MTRPRRYSAYLIDIEGVLVRDKSYEPVEGSVEWLNGLHSGDIRFCLVSNNTTHTADELIDRLRKVGFELSPTELVTVTDLAAERLADWGWRRILWLGDERMAEFWRDHDFEVVEAGPCDAVVLGVNAVLTIPDLDRALGALRGTDTELVALHRNTFWIDDRGEARLGPGAWCAALEEVSSPRKAVCLGKPAERIYRSAMKRVGVAAEESLFISDDPIADLVTARRMGMGTAFVLSGKYSDHSVLGRMDQDEWPDIICAKPDELAE